MKKKNTLYSISVVLIILVAAIYGGMTKASYVDDTDVTSQMEEASQRVVSIDDAGLYVDSYFNNNIDSYEDLLEQSILVARVQPTARRVNYSLSVLSTVDVIEVMKGDKSLEKKTIEVYEPANFLNRRGYISVGGYNLMKNDKEYILFLEYLKTEPEYPNKDEVEKLGYKPVSSLYAKYPIDREAITQVLNRDTVDTSQLSYDQVIDYDILTYEDTILEKYRRMKETVLEHMEE